MNPWKFRFKANLKNFDPRIFRLYDKRLGEKGANTESDNDAARK